MAESRGREQRESTRRDDELIIIGGFAVHFSSNGFPNTASPLEKEFLRGQPHQHGYRQRVRRRGCAITCDTKNGPLRALGLRRNRLGLRRNLSQKVSFRTMTKLPSPNQTWSHSTNSLGQLIEALKGDDDVTAIEADILMGRVLPFGGDKNKNNFNDDATACVGKDALVPIMSHPPHRTSDLSAKDFIHRILNSSVSRHMKLDFKEMDAVQPTLQHLHKFPDSTQTIFLNADILPGPGRYPSDIMVPADKFVSACLEFVQQSKQQCAFSLGFKVDVCSLFGHRKEHVDDMSRLIDKYELEKKVGIVLALNARLLAKNLPPFGDFLERYDSSQLLIWTGQGEPPIPRRKVHYIQEFFDAGNLGHRIGFDVQTATSGHLYDLVIAVIGLYKFVKASLSGMLLPAKTKQS